MEHDHTIPTGFQPLDEALGGGVHGGSLTVIASRPGMGKTAFCLQCAAGMAKSTDKKIYLFSMDLSSDNMIKKFTEPHDRSRIIVDDSVPVTPSKMREKLAGIPALGAVIVDYFQLLQADDAYEQTAAWKASKIAGELKRLSKEFGVPVICNSQLSRTVKKREDRRPVLRDLRARGTMEVDADVVIFLYRDAYHDAMEPADRPVSEAIIAKNRYGDLRTFFFPLPL